MLSKFNNFCICVSLKVVIYSNNYKQRVIRTFDMQVNFGGVEEEVVKREEFPLDKARSVLKDETIAVLGYGSQGPGQSQNLRDNGFNVIVGQRDNSHSYQKAIDDGWKPGETLFPLEEAAERGTIVAYLLSDAAQSLRWKDIKPHLHGGNAFYISHGFPVHFSEQTGIVAPPDLDVIMVAPKGAGLSVRSNFLDGRGINSSFSVEQDPTGRSLERVCAMGMGIGSGYLFETTAAREVISDHFGERAILLGQTWALAEAAYSAVRRGQDPREAFMDSSEQMTQVIYPIIGDEGATGIYKRAMIDGQLATVLKYQELARDASQPLLDKLYKSVVEGTEAQIALDSNSNPAYRQNLAQELAEIEDGEMWVAGKALRDETDIDRKYQGQITNWALAGAIIGAMEAQYQTLIDNGHSPSEAYNETVEEATQSLNQFYQAQGAAHLLAVCSTTAQRGALDWGPKFMKALRPIFLENPDSFGVDYIGATTHIATNPNMWDVGKTVRELRPEFQKL